MPKKTKVKGVFTISEVDGKVYVILSGKIKYKGVYIKDRLHISKAGDANSSNDKELACRRFVSDLEKVLVNIIDYFDSRPIKETKTSVDEICNESKTTKDLSNSTLPPVKYLSDDVTSEKILSRHK